MVRGGRLNRSNVDRGIQSAEEVLVAETEKLARIVQLLAAVRSAVDGGWCYSSPLIRSGTMNGSPAPMFESPDALGVLSVVAADAHDLSNHLSELHHEARDLGVDTVALCSVNLDALAGIYLQLSLEIQASVRVAQGEAQPAAPKPEGRRRGRQPKAVATQTMLDGIEQQPTVSDLGTAELPFRGE